MRFAEVAIVLLALCGLAGCDPYVADEQIAITPPGPGGWTITSPLPSTRQSATAQALESLGLLQFIGGSDGATARAETWVFDPSTSVWSAGNLLPTASGSLSSVMTPSGDLLALGGGNGGTDLNGIQSCSGPCLSGAGAWSSPGTIGVARERFGSVTVGGLIYLVGGCEASCPFSSSSRMEVLDPTTFTVTPLASLPLPRLDAAVQAVDGVIYVIGGNDGGTGPFTDVQAYTIATDMWSVRAAMPVPVEFPASGVLNGSIYVSGGGFGGVAVTTTLAYNPVQDHWFYVANAPFAVNRQASAVLGGKMYVIAGDVDYGNTPQATTMVFTP